MIRHSSFVLGHWLAGFAILALAALAGADEPRSLAVSEPIVLAHPPIDKSIGNPVHCLVFTRDGKRLATGAASGVLIWDTTSGKLVHKLEADGRGVDVLALDPRGAFLVAGTASGIIRMWDTKTWKEIRSLGPASGGIHGLALSPDGKLLASASSGAQQEARTRDHGILLWDVATGKQVRKLALEPPQFGTTALAFLPDGKRLLAAQDREIHIWDVATGKELKSAKLSPLLRSLGSIALRQEGRCLVTGALEPRIRLWDTDSGRQLHAWDAHHQAKPPQQGVVCVACSPDGKLVLSGGMDGKVCIWDADSGRSLLELAARNGSTRGWITGIALSPDGTRLAATCIAGSASIWQLRGPTEGP